MAKNQTLSELQESLYKIIRSQTKPDELLSLIIEKPPLSISNRIQIYQDAYRIRLFESIQEDFARVQEKAGPAAFKEMISHFIKMIPSKTKNLAEYSVDFPPFVENHYPSLYTLACLDWLEILSEKAPDPCDQLSPQEIQNGIPFTVKLHPATHLQKIGIEYWCSFRKLDKIYVKSFDKIEFEFLLKLMTPHSIHQVIDTCRGMGFPEDALQNKLSYWIENEIIFCERAL